MSDCKRLQSVTKHNSQLSDSKRNWERARALEMENNFASGEEVTVSSKLLDTWHALSPRVEAARVVGLVGFGRELVEHVKRIQNEKKKPV